MNKFIKDNWFKIIIAISIIIIAISIGYYFTYYLPSLSLNKLSSPTDNALKCAQLYELKKSKYWGEEIGQSKSIFNPSLNTCLALNIYNDAVAGEYFAMVMDMTTDKSIMYYGSTANGFYFEGNGSKKISCMGKYELSGIYGYYIYFEFVENGKETVDFGCNKTELQNKMFEKVRSYGFKIMDGFKFE